MILLLAPEAAERGELATLLEQLGHQVTVHAPAGVPPALTAPERCDVIVLTSTPVRMPSNSSAVIRVRKSVFPWSV